MKLSDVFKNPDARRIRIPKVSEQDEKSVEKDHWDFFYRNKICFFETKVKGEIQSIGHGQYVMKGAKNPGFFDAIVIIDGKFVGIEMKAGKGGYWDEKQIDTAEYVNNYGRAKTLVTNALSQTIYFLKKEGFWESGWTE